MNHENSMVIEQPDTMPTDSQVTAEATRADDLRDTVRDLVKPPSSSLYSGCMDLWERIAAGFIKHETYYDAFGLHGVMTWKDGKRYAIYIKEVDDHEPEQAAA